MDQLQRKPRTPEGIALGARIKAARDDADLTQGQVAAVAGCSQQMIGDLERGKYQKSAYLVGIAAACGVSASWLATGRGDMHASDIPFTPTQRRAAIAFAQLPEFGQPKVLEFLEVWKKTPVEGTKPALVRRVTRFGSPPRGRKSGGRSGGGT